MAELQKVPGLRIDLAVDPGDYRIRVAREGHLDEAQLTLAAGQRVVLSESRLEPVPLEATAARGTMAGPELDGLDLPSQPPAPGGPGVRNVVVLGIGAVALRGDDGVVSGAQVHTPPGAGSLVELGYRRSFTDWLAVEGSFQFRGLEGESTHAGEVSTSRGSLVMGLTVGVRYTRPLSRHGLFLGVGGAAGAYMGVAGTTVTTSGSSEKQESGAAEYVPGGRVRISLDYFPTRRLLLGIDAGYSQIGRFNRFIGPRRDYSGPEAALTVGFGWGR